MNKNLSNIFTRIVLFEKYNSVFFLQNCLYESIIEYKKSCLSTKEDFDYKELFSCISQMVRNELEKDKFVFANSTYGDLYHHALNVCYKGLDKYNVCGSSRKCYLYF